MSYEKEVVIFNCLQALLCSAVSAILMLIAIALAGWFVAVALWLASGYLGACLTCGLVLNSWEGAKGIVFETPTICDAPPTWLVLLLGPIVFFR